MIKSSSLLYAVFLCTIIGCLCSVLLIVFSTTKLDIKKTLVAGDFVSNSKSCFDTYFQEKIINSNVETYINKEFDFCTCEVTELSWGVLTLLKQKVFFKKDTLFKNVISGAKTHKMPAVYKANRGTTLKLSGTTEISGNMFVPNGKLERVNILGNQFENNPKVKGEILESEHNLPETINTSFSLPSKIEEINFDLLKQNKTVFNSFFNDTKVVYLNKNDKLDNLFIKGRIVLISNSPIELFASSKLEDVIVVAPKVTIKKGFNGSVQVFATENILVEKEVFLSYPSCLILNSNSVALGSIIINDQCDIFGNIILNSKLEGEIYIKKNTTVNGIVYCKGALDIEGTVLGSVYTNTFKLSNNYSKHKNVLLNTKIIADKLGDKHTIIPVFKNINYDIFSIIKEI